jgi:hypothetical protein
MDVIAVERGTGRTILLGDWYTLRSARRLVARHAGVETVRDRKSGRAFSDFDVVIVPSPVGLGADSPEDLEEWYEQHVA